MQSFNNVSTKVFLLNTEYFLFNIDVDLLNSQDKKELDHQKRKLVGEYLNKEEYFQTIGFNSEKAFKDHWNKKIKIKS